MFGSIPDFHSYRQSFYCFHYNGVMPRPSRADEAGGLYHALNRGNARMAIFWKDEDYAAFEQILSEGLERYAVRLYSYQLMPNHWHLVLRPTEAGAMSHFLRWVTATHTMRYHAHYHTSGEGHIYQGRFKSFPIQDDAHFLTVCRYVERNALRAQLVSQAEDWRWGSLWCPEPNSDRILCRIHRVWNLVPRRVVCRIAANFGAGTASIV